jgi:hypothetical protein
MLASGGARRRLIQRLSFFLRFRSVCPVRIAHLIEDASLFPCWRKTITQLKAKMISNEPSQSALALERARSTATIDLSLDAKYLPARRSVQSVAEVRPNAMPDPAPRPLWNGQFWTDNLGGARQV